MVPFYGQGMNAGFEDVRVLLSHIENEQSILKSFEKYSYERKEDLHSIVNLAMGN